MSTLTIPKRVVPYMRSGAQLDIVGACEQLALSIDDAMTRGVAPLTERRRLLHAWRLVDLLGWPDEACGPVEVNVHEYRGGLLGALNGNAARLAHMISEETDETRRAEREDDLRALQTFEAEARGVIERDAQTSVKAIMPGGVVELLRGALFADLERACEDMPATEPSTRGSWESVLTRLDQARRGLDVIGWAAPAEQLPVTVLVDTSLIEALERDAEHWQWVSEQKRTESEESRAGAAANVAAIDGFYASLAELPAPSTLPIPIGTFDLIREGVNACVEDVSDAISSSHDWRECAGALSELCDLLDLIGWSKADEPEHDVDASAHAATVAKAGEAMLPVLTRAVADTDGTDRTAAERQLQLMIELHGSASKVARALAC